VQYEWAFSHIMVKIFTLMAIKYKVRLRDLKLEYLKEYIAPLFNFLKPKKKITNISELKDFIQRKSAWVSQETLYGYLKTRMGAKYILMFDDEIFLGSINKAKWNIFAVALQDLTFYCLSYLKSNSNFDQTLGAKDIYEEILNEEIKNEMPNDIIESSKKKFNERLEKIEWNNYYNSLPFNESALALYKWSPVAEELKSLDKKIVLNSMILKWDNIKKEFINLINF
tara:strand:+ start:467 stop:1144 length:678 start_codon:yes stop_codon:yes gene_type:complete